jgi:hypothetical protein
LSTEFNFHRDFDPVGTLATCTTFAKHPRVAHECETWRDAAALISTMPVDAVVHMAPDVFHMLVGHDCGCEKIVGHKMVCDETMAPGSVVGVGGDPLS